MMEIFFPNKILLGTKTKIFFVFCFCFLFFSNYYFFEVKNNEKNSFIFS